MIEVVLRLRLITFPQLRSTAIQRRMSGKFRARVSRSLTRESTVPAKDKLSMQLHFLGMLVLARVWTRAPPSLRTPNRVPRQGRHNMCPSIHFRRDSGQCKGQGKLALLERA